MIIRTYFMIFRKAHGARYAENSLTISHKSWLPEIDKVFKAAHESAKTQLKDQPGETVVCMAFNRL